MFDELPETIPHKNTKKLKTFAFAAAVQVVLVASLIIIQMAAPEKLGEFQLLTTLYMAAPPPPPPAAAEASPAPRSAPKAERRAATHDQTVIQQQPEPKPVEENPQIVAPTAIPNDIARIVDAGSSSTGVRGGIPGGLPGGIPGGINGGTLSGVLGGVGVANIPPLPPSPIRVGGNVKQPKLVHIEQPHYPPTAKKARIEGVVILEATVTADGNVDKVKVISGPPLLTDAATEALSHWKYEPTYLNGQAVPVILTARISFSLSDGQQ